MEVVLLATGSADGWPNPFCACASCLQQGAAGIRRGPTSALVDDVLLLDCGTGVPAAALTAGRRLDRLRAVLLTHDHPDHSAPMALLARAWAKGKSVLGGPDVGVAVDSIVDPAMEPVVDPAEPRTLRGSAGSIAGTTTPTGEPLQVVGPAAVLDTWRPWCGPDDAVTFLPVAVGDRLDVAGYTVTVLAAAHEQPAVLYLVEDATRRRVLWASDTGPLPDDTVAALADEPVDLLLLEETFGDWLQHGTQHLDLSTFPSQLARLREAGAVGAGTDVVAVHLSHHNPPEPRLASRLGAWGARAGRDGEVIHVGIPTPAAIGTPTAIPTPAPTVIWGHHPLAGAGPRHHLPRRTLILGGARSGKSTTAEGLLAAEPKVLYLATGPTADTSDEAWADRVRRHREQRPATWTTVETSDAATVLRTHSGPVLFDCVGTWLSAAMDDAGAWDDREGWESELQQRIDDLTAAWRAVTGPVVAVSNEVGSGVVPATRSGGLYRDWLGRLNQRLAGESERVLLIVAGRIVDLSDDA